MGEAKRRGTKEQRIAQSVERRKQEDAALHAKFQREEADRMARLRALPLEERKEVILAGPSARIHRLTSMMLAAALGASAPLLVVRNRGDDIGQQ